MSSSIAARRARGISWGRLQLGRSGMVACLLGGVGTRALARAFVIGFPLLFVVVSWFAGAGYPYYIDNNETFLSFVHARNLESHDPWRYGWLTLDASDPLSDQPPDVYSHNPNGPRYLHYLLLRVGVRDLPTQVLILSVVGTALTGALVWRAFGEPRLLVVAFAVVLDFTGFLAWTVNTYRIWTLALFFGLVWAVTRARPIWVAALAFALFQIEYGFALFAATTMALLALLLHGRRSGRLIGALAIGAGLALVVFAAQVLTFYGWQGFLAELGATYARRGADGAAAASGSPLDQTWDGVFQLLVMMVNVTYGPVVVIEVAIGLVLAAWTLVRRPADQAVRLAACLTLAAFVGLLTASTVLHGYFVDAFVRSLLPLPVLLIAPSIGVIALELRRLLMRTWRWPGLGVFCGTLALLPLALASAERAHAPVAVDLIGRLQTEYRGRTILAPSPGPQSYAAELAFALTGGRGIRASDIDATSDDVRRFESLRDSDGTLTYMCLDTVYLRWRHESEAIDLCDAAADRMTARGHEVVERGTGWVIMRLNREDAPGSDDEGRAGPDQGT